MARIARKINAKIIFQEKMSFIDVIVVNCFPAKAYTKKPGTVPKLVVQTNVQKETLASEAKILIIKRGTTEEK